VERARSRVTPFDVSPLPGSSFEDVDLDLFQRVYLPAAVSPEVLAQNRRSPPEQMVALNLLTPEGQATVLGLLVAGRDPLRWLPGAYVQFVRIAGTGFTDPIRDQKRATPPLPEMLRALDELLHLAIEVETDILSQAIEQRSPTYPVAALQQLLWNAVMHRTYEGTNAPVMLHWFDDRIEISSPGGPYGKVTRDNFGTPGIVDYRNPNLAGVMRQLGYAQRFGFGIMVARETLAKNGNPEPEFQVTDTHVVATLRRRP
jgi:ATP-dependent DNA helicase RecG